MNYLITICIVVLWLYITARTCIGMINDDASDKHYTKSYYIRTNDSGEQYLQERDSVNVLSTDESKSLFENYKHNFCYGLGNIPQVDFYFPEPKNGLFGIIFGTIVMFVLMGAIFVPVINVVINF